MGHCPNLGVARALREHQFTVAGCRYSCVPVTVRSRRPSGWGRLAIAEDEPFYRASERSAMGGESTVLSNIAYLRCIRPGGASTPTDELTPLILGVQSGTGPLVQPVGVSFECAADRCPDKCPVMCPVAWRVLARKPSIPGACVNAGLHVSCGLAVVDRWHIPRNSLGHASDTERVSGLDVDGVCGG